MEPLLILNHQQIQQKINRMAYQIFENNFAESDIVLAGIEQRGFILAQRIEAALKKFSSQNIILLSVDVEKDAPYQKNQAPIIAADLIKDKVVIVVDDVLNSGKTLIYGVNRFLHGPVKKIATLVLVDRNHKSFPVNADYVGLSLATTFKQHIKVVFSESGDAAYLQ